MKSFIAFSVFALSLATFSNASFAESSCGIAGTDPTIEFKKATTQNDEEYLTLETVTHQGVTFYLKAGHGVGLLQAFINKKRVAGTFYQYGNDPASTDSLTLEVLAPNGKYIEAQCYNIDSHLP